MEALVGLIPITVAGGVAMKFADHAFSEDRPYMRPQRRSSRRSRKSTRRGHTRSVVPKNRIPGLDAPPGNFSNIGF